jgi:hypothetical protein
MSVDGAPTTSTVETLNRSVCGEPFQLAGMP